MKSMLSSFMSGPRQTRGCTLDAVPPERIGLTAHGDLLPVDAPASPRAAKVDTGAGLGFAAGACAAKSNGRPLQREPRGREHDTDAARLGTHAACAADASASTVVTVVRSALWTDDGGEDYWLVELPRGATVAELKRRIAELHGVPEEDQLLQVAESLGDGGLPDSLRLADSFARRPVHLLPARLAGGLRLQEHQAAMEESAAAERAAFEESLRHVVHRVRFVRPQAAVGSLREETVWLTLDALLPMQQVYARVEEEMNCEHPIFLTYNGQLLPNGVPLYFTGVSDGDTVIAAWEPPTNLFDREEVDGDSDDSLDDAMQQWAAN